MAEASVPSEILRVHVKRRSGLRHVRVHNCEADGLLRPPLGGVYDVAEAGVALALKALFDLGLPRRRLGPWLSGCGACRGGAVTAAATG